MIHLAWTAPVLRFKGNDAPDRLSLGKIRLLIRTCYLTVVFFAVTLTWKGPAAQTGFNHLKNETSPYLRQHARNPVDWYPWGREALDKAKSEDKLMVISIGYSSCHWCHVMEKEAFSDTAVSAFMNNHFVSIKVDREERPDIDRVYLSACRLVNGDACGWPLNIIALPDGKPVFSGTYMEKKQWLEMLAFFRDQKNSQTDKLVQYGRQLSQRLQQESGNQDGHEGLPDSLFHELVLDFLPNTDTAGGGLQGSPKFPMTPLYEFLLAYHALFGGEGVFRAVESTLDHMMKGGIYDWLEGGFSRYSVDEAWTLPHFEKMLYDNARAISLYAQAFRFNGKKEYREVVRACTDFLENQLKAKSGGYFSSFDADSEGEEGKYYLWSLDEVEQALADPGLFEMSKSVFGLSEEGNTLGSGDESLPGKNVLAFFRDPGEWAAAKGWTPEQAEGEMKRVRERLLAARLQRTRPAVDSKIICSWNALVVIAYADAFQALGEKTYKKRALENGEFIWKYFVQKDGSLSRLYDQKVKKGNAFLEDYAYTGLSYVRLYQISFEEKWLKRAQTLANYALRHFYDSSRHAFYYTSGLEPALVARTLDEEDGVLPSSNAAMATLLFQLGTYFDDGEFLRISGKMVTKSMSRMREEGMKASFAHWSLLYIQTGSRPLYEIAVVGKNSHELSRRLASRYIPNALLLGGKRGGKLDLLQGKYVPGKTLIYVCQNKVCQLPVEQVEDAWRILDIKNLNTLHYVPAPAP